MTETTIETSLRRRAERTGRTIEQVMVDDRMALRTQVILRPSRTHLSTAFDRLTQVMCDAMRRSHGSSTCELCDEPCNNLEAQAAARVAMALGAREVESDD